MRAIVMRPISVFLFVILNISPAFSIADEAQENTAPRFEPARLPRDLASFTRNIEFPANADLVDEPAVVFCNAHVEATGLISEVYCRVSMGKYLQYKLNAINGMKGQPITPARIRDKAVEVFMRILVLFLCRGSSCEIIAAPNHGQLKDKYGLSYSAPQLLGGEHELRLNLRSSGTETLGFDQPGSVILESRQQFFHGRSAVSGDKIALAVEVDSKGVAKSSKILFFDPDYKTWARQLAQHVLERRYIPGFYNNKPIESTAFHTFWIEP